MIDIKVRNYMQGGGSGVIMSQIDGNAIGRLRGKAAIERVPDQPPSHHFSSNQSVLPTPPASYHNLTLSQHFQKGKGLD